MKLPSRPRLPVFIEAALQRLSGPMVLGVGAAAVLLAGVAIVLASSGGDDGQRQVRTRSDPTQVARGILSDTPPTSTPQPTVAPTATAQPAANRANCTAIQGTPYLSDAEREWFHANCSNRGPVQQVSGPQPAPGGGQQPTGAQLIIPSIGVNAPIWRTSVGPSGAMPDPTGYFNVLQYDFPSFPGLGGTVDSGNVVIAGHVDSAVYGIAVFYYIRNLKAGDSIQYRTADGRTVNYVVTGVADYLPTANWEAIVASNAADMTLITCIGTFNAAAREYSHRRVVHARKV
jgi:LPXTG-site transpeptidase (sortase) family protein